MIEIVTKNGKKIGKISDSLDQNDTLIIDGKEISLTDAYINDSIKETFNNKIKELKNVSKSDDNS